jgi:putative hydrolase of HD superfamily
MFTKESSANIDFKTTIANSHFFDRPELPFVLTLDALKSVERQTQLMHGLRLENTAEHSWHLAMSVIALQTAVDESEKNQFRLDRAIQMALVHDVVEIDAGDTFLYADTTHKKSQEDKAADRIFGLLKNDIGESMHKLWHEFETRACYESRFVAAVDRFLPLYTNYLNQGFSWKNNNVTPAMVRQKSLPLILAGSKALHETAQQILSECETKNYI